MNSPTSPHLLHSQRPGCVCGHENCAGVSWHLGAVSGRRVGGDHNHQVGVNDVSVMGCAAAPPPGLRTLCRAGGERGWEGKTVNVCCRQWPSQSARETRFGTERGGGQAVEGERRGDEMPAQSSCCHRRSPGVGSGVRERVGEMEGHGAVGFHAGHVCSVVKTTRCVGAGLGRESSGVGRGAPTAVPGARTRKRKEGEKEDCCWC